MDHILSSIIYRGHYGEHKINFGGFTEASSGNNKQNIKIEKCIEQNKPYEWDKSDDPGLIPIRIIYSKDNTDVYIVGYAPAEEEITREEFNKFSGMNTTLKKCNFNPAHVAVTEAGRKIPNVNGGQLIVF